MDKDITALITSREVTENWCYDNPREGKKAVLRLLEGKKSAIVVLPDLRSVAEQLEAEITEIADILSAPPFARRLADESTVDDYFCWGPEEV